jgi:hypothetical protein
MPHYEFNLITGIDTNFETSERKAMRRVQATQMHGNITGGSSTVISKQRLTQ